MEAARQAQEEEAARQAREAAVTRRAQEETAAAQQAQEEAATAARQAQEEAAAAADRRAQEEAAAADRQAQEEAAVAAQRAKEEAAAAADQRAQEEAAAAAARRAQEDTGRLNQEVDLGALLKRLQQPQQEGTQEVTFSAAQFKNILNLMAGSGSQAQDLSNLLAQLEPGFSPSQHHDAGPHSNSENNPGDDPSDSRATSSLSKRKKGSRVTQPATRSSKRQKH